MSETPKLSEPLDFVSTWASEVNHVVDCERAWGWKTLCSREITTPEAYEYVPALRVCEQCKKHLSDDQRQWLQVQIGP